MASFRKRNNKWEARVRRQGIKATCKTFKIETLKKNLKYLKLIKQFNINWKAAAVAHYRSIENVDSDSKVSLNQLANRCERQIKIFYKKLIS